MEEILQISNGEDAEESLIITEYGRNTFTVTPLDESVVKDAIAGDVKAFEALFMGTYRYVFAAVRKYLKNDQDAYDAIQDTYMKVYKALPRLESVSSFYPWLHRIAENSAKDVLRLSGRDILVDDEGVIDAASAEDKSYTADVSADITEVLKQLPAEQTDLLIRVYYDKMRVAEIARMQGVPVTTVHNRLIAAKKKLKELLKIRGIEKPMYSGEFISMITTALRNAIGTELLSLAIAEEILHSVVGSNNPKGAAVISRFARKARSKAALKIASLLLVFCLLIVAAVLITASTISKIFYGRGNLADEPSAPPASDGADATLDENGEDTSATQPDSTDNIADTDSDSPSEETPPEKDTITPPNGSSVIDDPFYLDKLDTSAELVGSFEETENFGTHTEDGYLNIATSGDRVYAYNGKTITVAKKDATAPEKIIENFEGLYGESGCFLNVFDNRFYWINIDSQSRFVLNRCNLDGSGHYTKVFDEFDCTYLTNMLVAKDGVYFLAGKQDGFNYIESATLYRTDYDFNIKDTLENVADYTIVKDKIYYLYGRGNAGVLFSANRATFENRTNISPDYLSHGSIHSVGEYLVLGQYNKYAHSEFSPCTNLTLVDSTTGKIVRILYGEVGWTIDVRDVSPLNGGTVIYYHNGVLKTLNITTGVINDMSTVCGTVYGEHKYFIKTSSLRMSTLDGDTSYGIH